MKKFLSTLFSILLAIPAIGAQLTNITAAKPLTSYVPGLQPITLAWDSSGTNISTYTLYWGLIVGTNHIDTNTTVTGNVLRYTFTNTFTSGLDYWFVVTAKDLAGLESLPSNEIRATVPWPSPDQVPGLRYTTYWQDRNPWMLRLDWFPVTNLGLSNYKLSWGRAAFEAGTDTGLYLTTNTLLIPPDVLTTTVSNLASYSTNWFVVTAVSTNDIEGPKSDEIRYYAFPIAPQRVKSFRQVITVAPGPQ